MATRENIGNTTANFQLSTSEQIALCEILDKISRDKSLTTQHQYVQAGSFRQLFDVNRADGTYQIQL